MGEGMDFQVDLPVRDVTRAEASTAGHRAARPLTERKRTGEVVRQLGARLSVRVLVFGSAGEAQARLFGAIDG